MKVKELIKKLEMLNPEKTIYGTIDKGDISCKPCHSCEHNDTGHLNYVKYCNWKPKNVTCINTGKKVPEECTTECKKTCPYEKRKKRDIERVDISKGSIILLLDNFPQ